MEQVNQPKPPPNYLALAIITTILCCMPLGVISIIFSTQVNSKYMAGDYDGALQASKNAKLFWILSIALGLIIILGSFALFGFGMFKALENGEFNPNNF